MKKLIFLLWLFTPVIGFNQTSIVCTTRVFPKADKVVEFENALKLYVQKFHKLSRHWTVYKIETGPDTDGYVISEEPQSWNTIDSLNRNQNDQTNNWNKTVAIYLTERTRRSYYLFRDSLSTTSPNDTADIIILNHQFPKGGVASNVVDMLKREKNAWVGNESIAVYQVVNSGAPEFVVVTLLKKGLKELGNLGNFVQRFNAANGAGAWDIFNQDFAKYVESRWNETLYYRSDLSSKK